MSLLPVSPCTGTPPLWRPSRIVGWGLIPNGRGEKQICAEDRLVARRPIVINSLGQRDRERSYRNTDGASRVLVLGDSFVEALQVELADTFLARIENDLGVEMLNAGVSGYSTDNEVRAFKSTGRRYAPDVVILVFFIGNDVLENGARLFLLNPHGLPPKPWLRARPPSAALRACAGMEYAANFVASTTPQLLWQRSRVVRSLEISAAQELTRRWCAHPSGPPLHDGVPEMLGVYREPSTPAWTEAWVTSEHLLRKLKDNVTRAGARLGVVLAPYAAEYDPRMRVLETQYEILRNAKWDYDYPYRRLSALFEREGVPWMSLAPTFKAYYRSTHDSGCYASDAHWNEAGHEVVANALEPFVASLIGRRPPPRRTDAN
ncbi:MAG TPA: SGNH/GDSL hydrolase family protein [Candidatus Eisenbacteria bacterium]|nr:SGNH/GDSL hydrolase family protein [Candidatus Eisenbacteria bacterium]